MGQMEGILEQDDATSITMTSPSTKDDTPTHSIVTDDFERDIYGAGPGVIEAVHWGGETFVIRHRESGRAIAVNEDGDVRLTFFDNVATSQNCHWKCVEKNGWFGFKHEGRYLGHDGKRRF
jgi:predicted phage-related endonuclease